MTDNSGQKLSFVYFEDEPGALGGQATHEAIAHSLPKPY
jgi:hypothetical protein